MLKNLKVELMQQIEVKDSDILTLRAFNQRGGRLFFVDEYFDNSNKELSDGCHTAMELIPINGGVQNAPDTIYTINPVYIYNDENDRIINVMPLCEAFVDSKVYFTYWKDLFRNFIEEISEYIKYDEHVLVDFLTELIKDYPEQIYYYADGNNNAFSFEVLDQYQFVGKLTHGMSYGDVVIANINIIDKYTEEVIREMPCVQLDGMMEDVWAEDSNTDDVEYTFSAYLNSMSKEDMKKYILGSIEKIEANR